MSQVVLDNIFRRQLSIYSPSDSQLPVTILGAGMIGSPVALLLSKMGIMEISVYDGDTIEEHNFATQLYPKSATGKTKVNALADIINDWTYTTMTAQDKFWEGEELSGIVISAVDSLETRAKIWAMCRMKQKVKLFIDGRIGGQQISVYAIDPMDYDQAKFYDKTLLKKAEPLPCTQRGVIDVSFFCASLINRMVREYLVKKTLPWKGVIFDASELEILKYLV